MSQNNQNTQQPLTYKSKIQQNISSYNSPPTKSLIQPKEYPELKSHTNSNNISPCFKNYIQQLEAANRFINQQIQTEKTKTKDTIFNIAKLYGVGQLSKKRIQQWMETIGVKDAMLVSPTNNNSRNTLMKHSNGQQLNGQQLNGQHVPRQMVRSGTSKNTVNDEDLGFGEGKKKRKVNPSIGPSLGTTISNQSIINVIGKSGKDTNGLTPMEIRQYINGHTESQKQSKK